MLTNIEILIDKIKQEKKYLKSLKPNKIDETNEDKIVVKGFNESKGLNEEYEQFLKDDIYYLTKQLIDKSKSQSNTVTEVVSNDYFNKSEYSYTMEFENTYNKDQWFSRTDKIKFEEDIKININSNEYYSLFEKNIDFNKPPTTNLINVDCNKQYKLIVEAEESGELNTDVFLITYSDNEKLTVNSVKLNNEMLIKFSPKVKGVRIALRSSGKGSLKIKNIKIYSKKIIGFMQHKYYRELGFDKAKSLSDLKVAAICDDFTYECLKNSVDLITFTPEDWKAKLSLKMPHLLFVESAWHGKKHTWNRKISTANDEQRRDIHELIQWCKNNKIPTIFWNKEDPVHFDAFINTAKLCDYIFTTDQNKVNDYKKLVGHENVYSMQFFVEPGIHNPIKFIGRRDKSACFAGSYYANKYVERQKDMLDILDITKEIGLTIYDRNYGSVDEQYMFPKEYRKFIVGKLAPSEVYKAYKGYKYMINVNSVVESPTMFSRRVFEGLACGTPVISTYSKAIKNTFDDIVIMEKDKEKLKSILRKIDSDNLIYDKLSVKGIREVFKKHTINERIRFICDKAGIDILESENKVCIICEINSINEYNLFLEMYKKQSYSNKDYILVSTNKDLAIDKVVSNMSEAINYGRSYEFIAIMSVNNYYGDNYLTDLEIATRYCEANIIGKSNFFTIDNGKLVEYNEGKNNCYTTSIAKGSVLLRGGFVNKYDTTFIQEAVSKNNYSKFLETGERIYSIDKYNFIENNNESNDDFIERVKV